MPNVRNYPVGTIGWAGSTMRENLQEDVFIPCDARLVAVNVGPDGTYGSLVYDTNQNNEYDGERSAYLQSAFRVLKRPIGDANAIAFQLNRSGNGETKGGYFVDMGDGSTTNQSVPTGNVATSGSGMVATGGQGQPVRAGNAPGDLVTNAGKAGIVIGQGSYTDKGPFHVGNKADKHQKGVDADGNPINSLHLWTGALFYRNQVEDGPLRFEKVYKQGIDKNVVVPVHLAWAGNDWAWWSTTDTYHPEIPPPNTPTNPTYPNYPNYPFTPTTPTSPTVPTGGTPTTPTAPGVPTGGGGGGGGGGFTPYTGDLPGTTTGYKPISSGGFTGPPLGGDVSTGGTVAPPISDPGGNLGGSPTGYTPISSGGGVTTGGGTTGGTNGGTTGGGSSGGTAWVDPPDPVGLSPIDRDNLGLPPVDNGGSTPPDDPSAGDQGSLFGTQTPPTPGAPPGGGANPAGGGATPFDPNPNPPPRPPNFDLPFNPGGSVFNITNNSTSGGIFNQVSVAGALNTSTQTFQAQNYSPGSSDAGNFSTPASGALSKAATSSPLVGGLSTFAAQGGAIAGGITASGSPFPANTTGSQGDPWAYIATPRNQSFGTAPRSRYKSGTANGGIVYHPVETDLRDAQSTGMKPNGVTLNTFRVVTAPGAYFGCGVPELVNGGIKSGFQWGVDSTNGDLVFSSISSSQAPIEAMRFGNTTQRISFASQMGVNGTLAHYNTVARTWTFQDASGYVICSGGNVGFYGTTPVAQKTVTGSRAGNAALASLLTQLAGYGLIVDGSSV